MLRSLFTSAVALAFLIQTGIAGYVLTDDYSKDTFFGNFTAFTDADPTQGFVKYVDYNIATASKLIGSANGANDAAYMAVDSTTKSSAGRASVRITSKKSFHHGLFVADIAHMPGGICGTWPAFWLVGPDWPANGEVDIIEGVNAQSSNQMTLHTGAGCSIDNTGFSGTANTTNCDGDAPGQSKNAGCAISSKAANTFGAGFNAGDGGVYAAEWTSQYISIWFWPRGSILSNLQDGGTPTPSEWGTPIARFGGSGCTIDQHFKDMQIVFDTTFCGAWAGETWATSSCKTKAPTCEAFVEGNPAAFAEAYWLINSVRVFEEAAGKREVRSRRSGSR